MALGVDELAQSEKVLKYCYTCWCVKQKILPKAKLLREAYFDEMIQNDFPAVK